MRLTGEQVLARQLLREWGCSAEYAEAIAERILAPGPLNTGDAESRWASAN